MLKMVIEFDEEKVKKEGKYDLQMMYDCLAKRFTDNGLQVVEKGVYVDKGEEEDLISFMVIASVLPRKDWFVRYVKQWLWYEESEIPNNLIKTFELVKS